MNWNQTEIIKGKKYRCKRTLQGRTSPLICEINRYYKVIESEPLKVTIETKEYKIDGIVSSQAIFSPTPISSVTPLQFWDYFYTPMEERIFKLKKLKNI